VARQDCERAVLSVRPRLRANGGIVCDDVNAGHACERTANAEPRIALEVHYRIQLGLAKVSTAMFRIEKELSG
jgi:hypothetical protein